MKMERGEFLASILAVGLAVAGCGSKAKKKEEAKEDEDEDEERKRKSFKETRDKDRRAGLRELSRMTEEFGGYDAELK